MKRNSEWWARLTPSDRSRLVFLEKSSKEHTGRGGHIPDDCSECASCWQPHSGMSNLCDSCLDELIGLIKKADTVPFTPGGFHSPKKPVL